jgi:hypothetical protein
LAPANPARLKCWKYKGEDPICSDPEGTDRSATHARLVDAIAMALKL